ncbi:peptidase M48 Ste24p [Sphingomonas oleivorans]|uniref:Peptidase M48 Ste24p n=1 Tax=Sphingomonas oleivorans TaxID=1735121 RepID=A0A2T5FYM5_9SPHN|nr:M48 family metalloprotease [Sphingomonas oleivorans]PTQ11637.1 peptidase M48 Ste24p [Sphingomonas oleivorans]
MRPLILLSAAALAIGGTGYGVTQTVRSISASDKAAGARAHPQLLEEFGGAYPGPQARYVESVGKRIAVQSGLSNSQKDFTVTLLNSPVNNAFAIPGGYVYVTRQLLALMNDEAELASVLGHEVGHVAARHAAKRNRTSIFGQIAAAAAGVLTGNSQIAGIVGQGAQLVTLRFSRQQEYEADDLGIRYLTTAGYDPYASASMLASLNAQTSLEARVRGQEDRGLPTWASTHPNGADRVRRAEAQAAKTGVAAGTRLRNRDTFLTALDGVTYDDDPAQGIVDGQRFQHPALKLGFTAPPGYALANGTTAVSVSGSGGQAQFSGGAATTDLAGYIDRVFRGLAGGGNGMVNYGQVQATRINGLDAAYASARAAGNSGQQLDVTVFAYALGGKAYHFTTITPAGAGLGPFSPMIQSFTRLTDAQASAIKARRIDVVTVKAGDTANSLAQRMAYGDYKLERFLTLNALSAGTALRPGQKVKLIVYG